MGSAKRFFLASLEANTDDCILWPYAKYRDGYACIRRNGRTRAAHRVACEIVRGLAPTEDHEAAHTCGNGHNACINHKHVRWATPKENCADRILHGTTNRGERNGLSKLTERDVREMYSRFLRGEPQKSIAKDFPHLHPRSIYQITSGATWNEITGIERYSK